MTREPLVPLFPEFPELSEPYDQVRRFCLRELGALESAAARMIVTKEFHHAAKLTLLKIIDHLETME